MKKLLVLALTLGALQGFAKENTVAQDYEKLVQNYRSSRMHFGHYVERDKEVDPMTTREEYAVRRLQECAETEMTVQLKNEQSIQGRCDDAMEFANTTSLTNAQIITAIESGILKAKAKMNSGSSRNSFDEAFLKAQINTTN